MLDARFPANQTKNHPGPALLLPHQRRGGAGAPSTVPQPAAGVDNQSAAPKRKAAMFGGKWRSKSRRGFCVREVPELPRDPRKGTAGTGKGTRPLCLAGPEVEESTAGWREQPIQPAQRGAGPKPEFEEKVAGSRQESERINVVAPSRVVGPSDSMEPALVPPS